MTNGPVEGINNKLRVIARRAYGFHSHGALISMLFPVLRRHRTGTASTHSYLRRLIKLGLLGALSLLAGCVGGNCKFPIRGNRKPHTLLVGGGRPAFHAVVETNSEEAGRRCTDGRRGCC